jgi:hypothetical protein
MQLFLRLTKKNYGNAYTELPPYGTLKYAEKAFYDVPVAPVGITLISEYNAIRIQKY